VLVVNRRIRTRTYGGVGGRGRKAPAYPICEPDGEGGLAEVDESLPNMLSFR